MSSEKTFTGKMIRTVVLVQGKHLQPPAQTPLGIEPVNVVPHFAASMLSTELGESPLINNLKLFQFNNTDFFFNLIESTYKNITIL